MEGDTAGVVIIILVILLITGLFVYFEFITPMLEPWWAKQEGKAELAQAEQNRQIAILEAQAKMESSIKLAQAEIERAKGVAEANRIISTSITENYLRYLFVQGLQTNQMQTIYVPTNGFMPVWDVNKQNEGYEGKDLR